MNNEEKYRYKKEEILEAMKNREMKVYYQPLFDALTNQPRSAEALSRWQKPDGTLVMPIDFIPLLEETNDILELDWYVMGEVCRFLQKQKDGEIERLPVGINFSRRHTYEENFIERLCKTADEYEIPHELIIVEITESAFVKNPDAVIAMSGKIREKGFRIAIDDFGNGLSSLSFVKDVRADYLKIDKALMRGNCEDERERIILEAIFMFADRLGLCTIAEGVETKEQLGFLRTCGCNVIQGFLYSRPMPEEAFESYCSTFMLMEQTEDILTIQPAASAVQLLLQAVFVRYPLVIFSNLSRNSFYMMAYENFSSRSCPSTGCFEELIQHGASTMHPDDRQLFLDTFSIENQLAHFEKGEKYISVVTRQIGDDGVYRRVDTTNYLVRSPFVDDVLVISLCHNLE